MSLYPGCATLPDHVVQACNSYRKGGISAVAIIDTDAAITDFTNATQWQAAITAGTVSIIKNIKATLPKAAAVEGENALACGSQNMLDGFDGTFTWKDFNVNADNDAFYGVLNTKRSYFALYYCNEQEIRIVDQLTNFAVPWATAPEGNRDKQMYDATATWFAPADWAPSLVTAPTGIFI
jgi:hypothetical protein